ncbi:MAG: UTP--glucose-1-phosphate uridylyltransferase, partial [Victivallaceae bacterium]|nr:UTP--glucose-1-phosphate uridylyltransferase [Victivallaceae bacterium]
MDFKTLSARIAAAGQSHLLTYWDNLSDAERAEYAAQLENVDFEGLAKLVNDYVINRPKTGIPADLGPAPYFPLQPRDAAQKQLYSDAYRRGVELLQQGRVSCLTVAGGQGTRLGFNAPKGTYPIGPVSGRPLFRYFAESIARTGEKYGRPITWYIMTSMLN